MTRSVWTGLWGGVASVAAVLSLRPLVLGGGWILPSSGVVAAVVGAGILTRALLARTTHRQVLPVVVVQLLVLVAAVLVLFGGGTTTVGVLPGLETPDRFQRLVQEGLSALQRYSVPALELTGLRLLLVLGAGACALLIDLFAVTLRRPALAGAPLLAVLAVPVALAPGGSSAVAFLAVAVPYLVLLSRPRAGEVRADARTRRDSSLRSAATATTAAGAGAVLLAALVLPAAVPGLDEQQLRVELGSGDTITVINPILNLKASLGARSDATILTYETGEANPEPLRIVTADVFDGETWAPTTGGAIPRSQRVQDGLPPAPGLSDEVRDQAQSWTTTIAVRGLDQTYLPLPYPSERVDIEGDWLWEDDTLNVVGDGETTRGVSYTATHLEIEPTEDVLRAAVPAPDNIAERYTALPRDLPAVVGDTARLVTAEGTDAYERAAELQQWFRSTGGFTYSTDAPNSGGTSAVVDFLDSKSGFCVQFASAMAVMARSLDIPARVAIGFLPGEEVREGQWRISAQDAHAWPELWFSGVGWVRFEPTPATRTGQSPAWTLPRAAPAPIPGAPSAAPTSAAPTTSAPAPSVAPTTAGPAAGVPGEQPTGWRTWPWGWIALAVLAVLALALPAASAAVLRRRRWSTVAGGPGGVGTVGRDTAETAWADLKARTEDLGVEWPPSATPRAVEARLLAVLAAAPAVHPRPEGGGIVVPQRVGRPSADAPVAGAPVADAGTVGATTVGATASDLAALRAAVEQSRFGMPTSTEGALRTRRQIVLASAARARVDTVVAAVASVVPAGRRRRARVFPSSGVRALLQWWDRD